MAHWADRQTDQQEFHIVLPLLHGRFHIVLPLLHGQFHIGIPKAHKRFCMDPPKWYIRFAGSHLRFPTQYFFSVDIQRQGILLIIDIMQERHQNNLFKYNDLSTLVH